MQNRKEMVAKFVKELAQKTTRSTEDLLGTGLYATDFPHQEVKVDFEDGSSMNLRYAFFVENDEQYAIFTEHCGYYVFYKDQVEVSTK